jgi:hypothetical protein
MLNLLVKIIWIIFQLLIGYNLFFPIILYLLFLIKKKPSIPVMVTSPREADYRNGL